MINSPTANFAFFTPHFSQDEYTYRGELGDPTWPDLVAGGGKTTVTFMDGHGGAYGAVDFFNSWAPGIALTGNAQWQLDVN